MPLSPERTVALLQQLVRIDSRNPSLAPGSHGEGEIARFIARLLADAGIDVHVQEVAPGRSNVIGRLPGDAGGRTLLLNAHLDTVGAEGMEEPFSGRIEEGKLYGRGSMDTKGGLAAGLAALLALHEAGIALNGDLVMAGTADEEYASIGTEALLQQVRADGCIILEPRALAAGVAHGGFAWAEIETEGLAAHGSLPDKGVDAIIKMGHVLAELDSLGRHIHQEKVFYSALAGQPMRPSLHASLIQGGRELSSYADHCRLELERRMIPSETVKDVEAELDAILSHLRASDPQFKATWRIRFAREPWQASEGPLLQALDKACTAELGAPPQRQTSMGWTDAALTEQAGIPCIIFGPTGVGAHSTEEYVVVESVLACARVLAATAIAFCGAGYPLRK